MSLSNCHKCKYLDRHSHHSGDILCSLQPAYGELWKRLHTLDEYTLNCLPINSCSQFELDPSSEEQEITLALSYEQWQQVNRGLIPTPIVEQLEQQMIEITVSLTLQQCQDLAVKSPFTELVQQLEQQGIEVSFDGLWISVDSDCIEASLLTLLPTPLKSNSITVMSINTTAYLTMSFLTF